MKAELRDVVAKRTEMRELRAELGYKREEELLQRVALINHMNAFCGQINCGRKQQDIQEQVREIELGHEQLQSAMNAYVELEWKYDAEEAELRRREDELDVTMESVSNWVQNSDAAEGIQYHHDNDQDTSDSEKKDDNEEEYADDEMFAEDMHPLMVEYLQRMGDIEIREEHLEEVEGEYEDILNKQELRRRVNVSLDEESRMFLSSYKEQHEKAQKALDTTIQEANRLRELCNSEGLLHENTEDTITNNDNTNNKDSDSDDEIGLSQAIQNHQHDHPDPLKATAEEDTHPFFETQISSSSSSSSKFDRYSFINKWILHQLRHSSLQVSRFKSAPELRGISASVISQWALDVWFRDNDIMTEPPVSPLITENVAGLGEEGLIPELRQGEWI